MNSLVLAPDMVFMDTSAPNKNFYNVKQRCFVTNMGLVGCKRWVLVLSVRPPVPLKKISFQLRISSYFVQCW